MVINGESVTVKAEDKEGKVFKGWKDESGEIVSTQKEEKQMTLEDLAEETQETSEENASPPKPVKTVKTTKKQSSMPRV